MRTILPLQISRRSLSVLLIAWLFAFNGSISRVFGKKPPCENATSFNYLKAYTVLDRRFLYRPEVPSVTPSCRARALGIRPFRFAPGFVSDHSSVEELMAAYEDVHIVHNCPAAKNSMDFHLRVQRSMNLHECRKRSKSEGRNQTAAGRSARSSRDGKAHLLHDIVDRRLFRASTFLEKIRHRQLAFYGDSIGRQIFLDLVAELSAHQTDFAFLHTSNMSATHFNSTATAYLSHAHRLYSKRRYEAFNATILYFDDGRADGFHERTRDGVYHAWDDELRRSDVVVVGIGAWFKPWFYPKLNAGDYYDDMRLKRQMLNSSMWRMRETFRREMPHARIIWRLNAHVGNIDEMPTLERIHNRRFDTSTRGPFRHSNGVLWSNVSLGGVWPMYYNELYAPIAEHFGDSVLDYWHISVRYLQWIDQLVASTRRVLQTPPSAAAATPPPATVASLAAREAEQRFFPLLQTPSRVDDIRHFLRSNPRDSLHSYYPVMSDSLHYCPGTVPRAAAFMLHDLLDDALFSLRMADVHRLQQTSAYRLARLVAPLERAAAQSSGGDDRLVRKRLARKHLRT